MNLKEKELINLVGQIIYDKKGFNIIALDVKGISTVTDYFIIAEGNVDRHIQAIARELVDVLKKENITPVNVDGIAGGEWIVLDYLNFIIHLFIPFIREKYQIEELYNKAKLVSLKLKEG